MSAPATGDVNLPQGSSDLQPLRDQSKSSKPAEVDLTTPQSSKSKASPPPFGSLLGKRRKSKPVRYGFSQTTVNKKSPVSRRKRGGRRTSSMCLSSQEETSTTKGLKCPPRSLPAMLRAREVQSRLGSEHPSCIRLMVRTHVTTGFWMGLPLKFCRIHLPKMDTTMVIEDENGGLYNLKYVASKKMLSAGWRNFAVEHGLLEGDVLVFHLVEPCKFKVYIIRVNGLNDVDGALSLLNLEAHTEQTIPENNTKMAASSPKTKKRTYPRSLPLIEVQKKYKMSTAPSELVPPPQVNSHLIEHSGNDSEEVGSEVFEGSIPSKPNLSFQEVKSFEDFSIVVNGRCIDSELPDDVRMNYFKLCLANKDFLHDSFPQSMYYKLVAGMIGETVNIANEMKNGGVNTTREEFEAWDNSLKSFQLLGMKVDFLRDGLKKLVKLAFESEDRLFVKRYTEAKNERKRVHDEITKLTEKLVELEEISRKFEIITSTLKQKAENYKLKFKQEVDALW